MQRNKL